MQMILPMKLPENPETEAIRERQAFLEQAKAADKARRAKRLRAVVAAFAKLFDRKKKGADDRAPSERLPEIAVQAPQI